MDNTSQKPSQFLGMIRLFYFFVALMLSQSLFSQTLETDRLALIDLYNATNGPNWTNKTGWNVPGTPGDNPCSWYGVSCSGGRVSSLNLQSNQLKGIIPNSIGNLTGLASLLLTGNQLSDSIPAEMGKLINLNFLYLSSNQLSGNIPAEIGNLTNLSSLALGGNQLSGSIPAEMGKLINLTFLYLSYNQLSGVIPAELDKLVRLINLALDKNQLTGNFPTWIGSLTDLIILQLSNNQLSGSIPASIGNLTKLVSLGLNDNQLTGSVPVTMGNLTNLNSLALNNNQLTGIIPASIGNLTNLTNLSVQNNQLVGGIPNTLGSASKLKYIGAYNNMLTGELPAEIGNLIDLEVLNMYSNQLTGSIPASIGNLTKLKTLWLSGNQLTGNIPTSIGSLNQLTDLYLDGNQLTGNFNLSGIPASARVILQNNKFTFDGIESNASLIDYYSSQANIPITNTAGVLSVNAGGTLANNTYRWYKKNPTTLVATNVGNPNFTPSFSGTYFVQVSNSIATGLTLMSDDITWNLSNTPTFTTQPSNVTVCPNNAVSFTAVASNAVSYQWQVKIGSSDFVNLSEGGVYANVTSTTLTINNVTGLNGYQYRCVAIGAEGNTNSNDATLSVGTPTAAITLQSPADDVTTASPTKKALTITATNKIQATGSVIYQAVQSAVFNPGFKARAGSVFTAQIGGCN